MEYKIKGVPGFFDSKASAHAYATGNWEKYCEERLEKQDYVPFHTMDEEEIFRPYIVESTHNGVTSSEEYSNYFIAKDNYDGYVMAGKIPASLFPKEIK